MRERTETFTYPDGSIQRVQAVELPGFEALSFLRPVPAPDSFERVVRLYRHYAVPRAPFLFDKMVLFRLPADIAVPFPEETNRAGLLASPLLRAAEGLRRGVKVIAGKPVFLNAEAKSFWKALQERGCLEVVCGALPGTSFLPVADRAGYLTGCEPEAALKANLSFFTMDKFDICSPYDAIGMPIGLRVKDGFVESPPLHAREALLVGRDGRVRVDVPRLTALSVTAGGTLYRHGENAVYYERPRCRRTPKTDGTDIVILEDTIIAVKPGGRTAVPGAGFVLSVKNAAVAPGDRVIFGGMENILFGVQVGPGAVTKGVPATEFHSPFYNIKVPFTTAYPPSLYPLDHDKARAPRMALGATKEGRPLLVWAEGPGKLGYVKGADSRGASLSEMGALCKEMGMENGVNLDGGGSAQILLRGRRSLLISDRAPDNSELERAVPNGIIVRG